MMCIQGSCVGYFTRYHSPGNQALKPGKILKLINIMAVPMPGAASAWMKKEDWYLPGQVPQHRIFMAVNGKVTTCIRIVFWRRTQQPGNLNGVFRLFIMMCRTGIMQLIPYW